MMTFDELCRAFLAVYFVCGITFFTAIAVILTWDYVSQRLHQQHSQAKGPPAEPKPATVADAQRPTRSCSDSTVKLSSETPNEIEDPFERHMRLIYSSGNLSDAIIPRLDEHQIAANGAGKRKRLLKRVTTLLSRGQKLEVKKIRTASRTLADELAACDGDWIDT